MSIMYSEIIEQPSVLKRCFHTNQDIITQIASSVRASQIDSVIIAGRGTSDNAAIYGKYLLEYQIGLPTSLAAPSIITVYKRHLKLHHSLVIGISQSGQAEDVLGVIREANQQGAITVAIVNCVGSPLAEEAKYTLDCSAGVETSVAATKTFTAELLCLAMLAGELGEDQALLGELSNIPENVSLTIRLVEESLGAVIPDFLQVEDCFVLSRGMHYPIALEMALKIQETCYIKAKGYSTSDFQHGPIAMLESGAEVIIIAPDGPCSSEMKDMIARVKEIGAKVTLISDKPDFSPLGDRSINIASGSDLCTPFYSAIAVQLLACKLAEAKNLNPDSPRIIQKVTVTF